MLSLVVVGTPGDRRITEFQAARAAMKLPPATIISYQDVLGGKVVWQKVLSPGAIIRIESPGKCELTRQRLIEVGGGNPTLERGEVGQGTAWYRGLCHALSLVASAARATPRTRWMNDPDSIALLFDKVRCHAHLAQAGIPVAPPLGVVASYEELIQRMREQGMWSVFIKSRYGSSGSGIVAYRTNGKAHQAITTVEMVEEQGRLRLFNSRRLSTLTRPSVIARLVDALAADGVQVERWVPKGSWQNRAFDVRVVTIGGRARHTVARLSCTPLTNLHLLNERADASALRAHLGEGRWMTLLQCAEQVARVLPGTLYVGIDITLPSGGGTPVVLEANAFGDLLPDVLDGGEDTYTAELKALS